MKLELAHILAQHGYQAEDLQKKIKAGADFAQLATKFSLCSSAKDGGNLGLVSLRRLDSVFAEAAELLKPNEISGVVKTRFGYHLIQRKR